MRRRSISKSKSTSSSSSSSSSCCCCFSVVVVVVIVAVVVEIVVVVVIIKLVEMSVLKVVGSVGNPCVVARCCWCVWALVATGIICCGRRCG